MLAFVLASSVLLLIVLGLVLRPLWRTQKPIAMAAFVALALGAALLYRMLGTPAALDADALVAPNSPQQAIAKLKDALAKNPQSLDGWILLGRTYGEIGDVPNARAAFERALALAPNNPDLLVTVAEARALGNPDRRFDDTAVALLERALVVEPKQQRARLFLGVSQRQRGENAAAAATWAALLPDLPADAAAALRPQVDAARAAAGLPPLPVPANASATTRIEVRVELPPALAARVPTGASLFVFARAPDGPPMPVAAKKLPATGFPVTLTLSDADSPMPTHKLSDMHDVLLQARISASGDVTPSAGDLSSAPVPVTLPSSAPVTLTLTAPAN
jgi:cytochrome c-type biogenesis protein CcmH